MRVGLACLILGYVLSQFYRAFLAVLAPALKTEIGANADDLSRALGLWFLAFALMQIPVGEGLDRFGPRRVVALMLGLFGAGGALAFARATSPGGIDLAMILIGIGCAPVLMGAYYIFARTYSPAVFGTLAGATVGIGSLGNIAGSAPLAWALGRFGWRDTLTFFAGLTLLVALAIYFLVRDPPRVEHGGGRRGSVLDILKTRALWLILPLVAVQYAPSAGLRGVWAGPYLRDTYGLDASGIGRVTLVMGVAMVIGNFAYGPMERLFGSRKWPIFVGNVAGLACLVALWFAPAGGIGSATLLLAGAGLFGASFPMITAHTRSFFPPHLVGRGVTLINMFSISGVGLMQLGTARLFRSAQAAAPDVDPAAHYPTVFAAFALALTAGMVIYLFSSDRTD